MTDKDSPLNVAVESARALATADGIKLLELARALYAERVAAPNAQKRLQTVAAGVYPAAIAPWIALQAWTIAASRTKAADKLGPDADLLLFDSDGLQMASSRATAAYHARCFADAGAVRVLDATAGIGADAIALAQAGLDVVACELDPLRAVFLAWNVERFDPGGRIEVREADFTSRLFDFAGGFVYIDPPRRTQAARWGGGDVAEAMLKEAVQARPAGAMAKLSPAADHGIAARFGGDLEFVSAGGECREALLRLGALRTDSGPPRIAAVLLPSVERLAAAPAVIGTVPPTEAKYLYEPDPAVIRAGAVDALAARERMARIGPDVAYLLAECPRQTPFATGYRVLDAFPYHHRTVQAWLDQSGAGSLIVKKRGVPDDPEQVRREYKLRGTGGAAILCLTRQGKRVWALMLEAL